MNRKYSKVKRLSVFRNSAVALALLSMGLALSSCRAQIQKGALSSADGGGIATDNTTPFFFDWTFSALNTSLYTASDWAKLDVVGGVCFLKSGDLVDTGSARFSTADSATLDGVSYGTLSDSTSGLRLGASGSCDGASTNCSTLERSWTPKYGNLVGYWKLDGSGAIADGAPIPATVGTNGTVLNTGGAAMSYVTGKLGQGISLDGQSGWNKNNLCNLVSRLSASPNSATYSVWFNQQSIATGGLISASTGNDPRIVVGSDGVISFNFAADSNLSPLAGPSGGIVAVGTWNHVVGTMEDLQTSTPTATLYLNGRLIESKTFNQQVRAPSASICVGKLGLDSIHAFLDEAAVWNVALSAAEVGVIYDRQFAAHAGTFTSRIVDTGSSPAWTRFSWVPTFPFLKGLPDDQSETSTGGDGYSSLSTDTLMNGIKALWHFDETSRGLLAGGKDYADSSGNGFDLLDSGTSVAGEKAIIGKGIALDGGAGCNVPMGLDTWAGDFSISTWARLDRYNLNQRALLTTGSFNTNGFRFGNVATDFQVWASQQGGTVYAHTPIVLGRWTHYVLTFHRSTPTTGTAKLYADGLLVSSDSGTLIPPSQIGILLSGLGQGGWFGGIDEMAIWTRELAPGEVAQVYRRGASRLKFQVRSCTDAACAGVNWVGPDGTANSYYSELNNNTAAMGSNGRVLPGLPKMRFSDFSGGLVAVRYFQYRAILESDEPTSALGPELKSVTLGPTLFDSSSPAVIGVTGPAFSALRSFSESIGPGGCPGGVVYNLALDPAGPWKFWNGFSWSGSDGTAAQANAASVVSAHLSRFIPDVGAGSIYFKAYLQSSGSAACELDNVHLEGGR